MTKTQREHVEEFGRIGALFNRAIASSSQREKDANLAELKKTSVEEVQTLEEQIISNANKQKQLEELQKNYEILKKQHAIMQQNQLLLEKILTKDQKIDVKKMLNTISELENDIQSLSTLQRPNLVKNVSAKESRLGIRLYDVKLQRVEELIYALRKRILEVDKNEQYSSQIQSEFGNNVGLITTYKNISKENEQLKQEEFQCSHDVITKRRNITNMTDASIRTMIIFMQQELQTELKAIKTLHDTKYKIDSNPIESILNSPDFKHNLPIEHPAKKIQAMKQSLNYVIQDLKNVKGPDATMLKQAHDNEAKNLELMAYLLNKMTTISKSVDSANDAIQDLTTQLYQRTIELRKAKNEYHVIFDPYQDLLNSYVKLLGNQRNNISVSTTLSSISSLFSLKDNNLKSFLESAISNVKLTVVKLNPRPARKLADVPASNTGSKSKFHLKNLNQSPSSSKHGSSVTSNVTSTDPSPAPSAKLSRTNSVVSHNLEKTDKIHLSDPFFNLLLTSILGEIMAPIYSSKTTRLTPIWKNLHDKFIVSIENTDREFGEELHKMIEKLQISSHEILVKEKTENEAQTENPEMIDIEIQTEDTKPLKGKR